MNYVAEVEIRFEVEGFHHFPDAPKVVSFLEHPHRHTFIITMAWIVEELNREMEIFIEREAVLYYIRNRYGHPAQFEGMSCEHIAKDLLEWSGARRVTVWEENTGGATLTREE